MMTSKTSVRPGDRLSALKARQTLKMAASAHAYVRGSTANFYQWLDEQKRGTLPEGPSGLDLRRLPRRKSWPCGLRRRQGGYPDPGL